MGALFLCHADDATLVYTVYHNATRRIRCMYDRLIIDQQAHMYNFPILIVKKSQVAGMRRLQKVN